MAFTELSQDGKRMEVWFDYDHRRKEAVKAIVGSRFVGAEKDVRGPFWTVPLDLANGQRLRTIFGTDLKLGDALKAWGRAIVQERAQLKTLAVADTAELRRLPKVLPDLYRALHVGPRAKYMTDRELTEALAGPASFQAADVAFCTIAQNPLNGNQPGLGKTPETIAAIFEAGTDAGPTLVVAPKTSLRSTWELELAKWQSLPAYISTGSKRQKEDVISAFLKEIEQADGSGWLVVNPDQVRYREEMRLCAYHRGEFPRKTKTAVNTAKKCPDCDYELRSEFPALHEVEWSNVIVDEAHKGVLSDPSTLTARGIKGLKVVRGGKRFALTGTPMGGKVIKLWGILHYLNPDVFTSKWRWADAWTDITDNGFGKAIGDHIRHCPRHTGHNDSTAGRPDCAECEAIEEQFYEMLTPYITRRTKAEALPWLPAKDHIDVWCEMTSEQAKQYLQFANDAEVKVSGENVSATSILAEYTRLKQFSFGVHEIVNGRLVPTYDSGKLEQIEAKLEELGVLDGSTDEQVVIFSQFSQVVDLLHRWLTEKGVPCAKITGSVTGKKRDEARRAFQDDGTLRVLVMTTTAGGVSITLDRANSVFLVDETWDPDDQEQAEDRAHRASRLHQVTVYAFRTRGSIEEAIQQVTWGKAANNTTVLDLRRLKLKA